MKISRKLLIGMASVMGLGLAHAAGAGEAVCSKLTARTLRFMGSLRSLSPSTVTAFRTSWRLR